MEVKAKLKYYHVAPRKVRLVVAAIRGLNVSDAINQLENINKRSSMAVLKLLKSAIANATNNFQLEKDNLYIKTIYADQGSVFKRWMPKAHGSAGKIRKVTSHITLILDERIPSKKSKIAKKDLPAGRQGKVDKKEDLDLIDIKEIKKNVAKQALPKEKRNIKKPQQKSKSIKSFVRKAGEK